MSVLQDSRYNLCPIFTVVGMDGEPVENDRVDLPYPRHLVRIGSRFVQDYKVKAGDTWSNLAFRFFKGRSDLWWVIAEYSGIIDPFAELQVGQNLKIPQFHTVMFDVLTFDTSRKAVPSEEGAI